MSQMTFRSLKYIMYTDIPLKKEKLHLWASVNSRFTRYHDNLLAVNKLANINTKTLADLLFVHLLFIKFLFLTICEELLAPSLSIDWLTLNATLRFSTDKCCLKKKKEESKQTKFEIWSIGVIVGPLFYFCLIVICLLAFKTQDRPYI